MGVNVLGVINGIRTFVPMIRRHGEGGHVVNTASISGFFVRRGRGRQHRRFRAVSWRSGDAHLRIGGDPAGAVRWPLCAPATGGCTSGGLASELVGQRVLQAIRQREFYVLTHAGERAAIKTRHQRIEAAFDRAETWEKAR